MSDDQSPAVAYLQLMKTIVERGDGGAIDEERKLDELWWAMTSTERELLERTSVTHAPKSTPPTRVGEDAKAEKLRRIVGRIRGSVINHAKLRFKPDIITSFERVNDREDSAGHLRANLDSLMPSNVVALGHVLYMCSACDNFIQAGKLDKVQRWIGFAQGVLWLTGVASIDESREINS